MIACVDMNGGLGDSKGNLLFKIPEDLKHFKKETEGNIVVMGRKTFESLRKPLKNRDNYILTTNKTLPGEGVTLLHSKEEALSLVDQGNVFIIGGGQVYKEFMGHADMLIITYVNAINNKAITFFPEIDKQEWEITKECPLSDNVYDAKVKWYKRRV